MRLHKVYHRFSLFSLTPPLFLIPPSSKLFSSSSSKSRRILSPKTNLKLNRSNKTSMSASRLHNLTPIGAIAVEDGGGPNGSFPNATPTPQDDESHTRRLSSCTQVDRLTNLHEHLLDSILGRLPIRDAVRTSVLAKKWRYKWTTLEVLVFDEHFARKFSGNGAFGHNGYARIINQIFLLHQGPILKCNIHIPDDFIDSYRELDQWMLVLSRNGVNELTLSNSGVPNVSPLLRYGLRQPCFQPPPYGLALPYGLPGPYVLPQYHHLPYGLPRPSVAPRPYELPCSVFSCPNLKVLRLDNCIFKLPVKVEFRNLKDLYLKNVVFVANRFGKIECVPNLERLTLRMCKDVCNFNIKPTGLQSLSVIDCQNVRLCELIVSPYITTFIVSIQKQHMNDLASKNMGLVKLLSYLPKVETLHMYGSSLKLLGAQKIPNRLPLAANQLQSLWLQDFEFSDVDQLSIALCLLRSSPNLKSLRIVQSSIIKKTDVGSVSDHLEGPYYLDQTLSQLETVEVTGVEGSRPELDFLKLLLADSPSLEKLTIQTNGTCDGTTRLSIATNVLQFHRASRKAAIILPYQRPQSSYASFHRR